MLWMKAWMETRWKAVWLLFVGALLYGFLLAKAGRAPASDPKTLLTALLAPIALVFSLIITIFLAGTGIETASTRPGESAKGGEGSKLFTLSLPITRARLFWVRTVTGMLETGALLSLFAVAAWLLLPPPAGNAEDALGSFAVMVSFSMAVYAISACLSTFCDEGWRIRLSGLAVAGIFALSASHRLPRAIDIFRSLGVASPLITHQTPWATIIATGVLAVLFLAAAVTIIRKRDY
jgi:hypothetical protein